MCGDVCSAAVAAAAAADVAILCTSTFSCEGSDRSSLSMPAAEDALITAVAAGRTPSVVVVTAPGVALLPWSNLTAGILYIGMPGQEAGNAVADILTGAVVPSGKTTLTWPTVENQTQFSPSAYPGLPSYFPLEASYEEELLIGYRYFDAHNIAPAFPFGHGLSYTTFKYTALTIATAYNVSCVVTNVGQVTGAEVAQLYISFPASAGEPPLQLKGFQVCRSGRLQSVRVAPCTAVWPRAVSQKFSLSPGRSTTVTFFLTPRSFSIWDVTSHAWTLVPGSFGVQIGASSRDIRLKGVVTVA